MTSSRKASRFTGSNGHEGAAGASVYVGSKHAVEGITKSVALEIAKSGNPCERRGAWSYGHWHVDAFYAARRRTRLCATLGIGFWRHYAGTSAKNAKAQSTDRVLENDCINPMENLPKGSGSGVAPMITRMHCA